MTTPTVLDNSNPRPSRLRRLATARRRRGAAVVEFALVAPLFFTLVFGTVEYGRYVMVQQMLVNASREGARVRVLTASTDADATTAVSNYLSGAGVSGQTTTVTKLTSASTDVPYQVTVSIPFTSVSWTPAPWFLGSLTLTSSTVMRHETVQ